MSDRRHLVHRPIEHRFVHLGGARRPAQLPVELQGRRPNLVVGRGRREIGQRYDVTTHAVLRRCGSPWFVVIIEPRGVLVETGWGPPGIRTPGRIWSPS